MEKKLKDGKTQNITIRVTEELRQKAEVLWKKYYYEIPFNSFLGYLVSKGADEEEYIARYREKRNELKLKNDIQAQENAENENNPIIKKKASGG